MMLIIVALVHKVQSKHVTAQNIKTDNLLKAPAVQKVVSLSF